MSLALGWLGGIFIGYGLGTLRAWRKVRRIIEGRGR